MKTKIQTPSEELLEFAIEEPQRDDNSILEIIYDTKWNTTTAYNLRHYWSWRHDDDMNNAIT